MKLESMHSECVEHGWSCQAHSTVQYAFFMSIKSLLRVFVFVLIYSHSFTQYHADLLNVLCGKIGKSWDGAAA